MSPYVTKKENARIKAYYAPAPWSCKVDFTDKKTLHLLRVVYYRLLGDSKLLPFLNPPNPFAERHLYVYLYVASHLMKAILSPWQEYNAADPFYLEGNNFYKGYSLGEIPSKVLIYRCALLFLERHYAMLLSYIH